jgi:hypothetical protein
MTVGKYSFEPGAFQLRQNGINQNRVNAVALID